MTTDSQRPKVLLIGYGNPGRGDDGLGPALAAAIEARHLRCVTVEIDYQLTVDHAALIAAHDVVIFADAAIGLDVAYRLSRVDNRPPQNMGSHQITPAAALHLCEILFGKTPDGWILAIAGTEFGDVREGLSLNACQTLTLATRFLEEWISEQVLGCCDDRLRLTVNCSPEIGH
jgi:hydrogenase maturation protease